MDTKAKLCEVEFDTSNGMTMDDLRHMFNNSFLKKEEKNEIERYICQLIRLNGFDDDGTIEMSIDVPMNAYLFESFEDAVTFGDEHNGTMETFKGFWGEEFNYADNNVIYCGYIVYKTKDKEYCPLNRLPDNRNIQREKMCSPALLIKLQEAYEECGQSGMYDYMLHKDFS